MAIPQVILGRRLGVARRAVVRVGPVRDPRLTGNAGACMAGLSTGPRTDASGAPANPTPTHETRVVFAGGEGSTAAAARTWRLQNFSGLWPTIVRIPTSSI